MADIPQSRHAGFASAEGGNAAIFFGLALVPLVLGVGGAIDYSRASATRTALQNSLDAAVLAAAQLPEQNRAGAAATMLSKGFSAPGASAPTATWKTNGDGSFSGEASSAQTNAFMQIVNYGATTVRANATAARRGVTAPSEVTIQLNYATGWYWKRVKVWTRKTGSTTDTAVAEFVYQPTDLTWSLGRGKGTVTGPLGQAIEIGSSYDKLYMTMEVSTDGCGPGQVPPKPMESLYGRLTEQQNFACAPASAAQPKTARLTTYRTDDPSTSDQLFVNGVQMRRGASAQALDLFRCGQTVTHDWEDGGAFWAQDIGFNATATKCGSNASLGGGGVALVR